MVQRDWQNRPRTSRVDEVERVALGVIACAQTVAGALGTGMSVEAYESALAGALQEKKLKFARQYPFGVPFSGPADRGFYADFVVEGWVLLELKVVDQLRDDHVAQALDYLRQSGADLCLLINFGKPKVEVRRLVPPDQPNHAE